MEIEVKEGKVALNISGTFAPEELRQLLRKLCEAHADAAQTRTTDGQPSLPGGDLQLFADWSTDGLFHLGINSPVVGWVFSTINEGSRRSLLALLGQPPGVSGHVRAAQH